MKLTPQQDNALQTASRWIRSSDSQVFCLFGFAGTGKTTLAKHLVSNESGSWLFAAYTGKAAHVLREKGCVGASTIHSLIYRPAGSTLKNEIETLNGRIHLLELEEEELSEKDAQFLEEIKERRRRLINDDEPQFSLWINSPLCDRDVVGIVIDEVSMVDKKLAKDLESFGKKILVLGDPAQLPPVGAGGYYTGREPDIMLTEVHRHARESGILRVATDIREGRSYEAADDVTILDPSEWRNYVYKYERENFPQLLVGLNRTRKKLNQISRDFLDFEDQLPEIRDKIICLRNNRNTGVFNGSQWFVEEITSYVEVMQATMRIVSGSEERTLDAWTHHFVGESATLGEMHFYERGDFDEFDFAYAMTVHKAQGSQWEEVILFDQKRFFRGDAAKWLYTGVTRASERLVIVRGV